MSKKVVFVRANDTVSDAIKILRKAHVSGAPVINNEGNLVGIISESDVLRLMEYHPFLEPFFELLEENSDEIRETLKVASKKKVHELMSKKPITISPDTEVAHAAAIMWERNINRLPVVDEKDEGKVVGIITRADILKAF
jgi:CBS domain-containing protein